jgi:choline transporter-like protein 2/4/5
MRSRINLAISIVKEAAKVLAYMPILVFTPLLQFFGSALFFLPWIFYVLYLAGSGTVTTVQYTTVSVDGGTVTHSYKKFEFDRTIKDRAWYLLFVLLWTLNFIVAFGQIANAMAVGDWYFSKDKKSLGNITVFKAYKRTLRYHVGTAAFGAAIIAIIEFIRAVILYMEQQAKAAKNKVAEYVLSCLQCCMWCVEKCLKFINRNAYIQTALLGKPFFPAAKAAFFLILRNILRIAAVSTVSGLILLVGKVFVMALAGGLSYYFLQSYYSEDLNSLVGPTLLVMALAWFTASMFCEVFGMAIDTILQCFIVDEEWFEAGQRHAEADLKAFVDKNGGRRCMFHLL